MTTLLLAKPKCMKTSGLASAVDECSVTLNIPSLQDRQVLLGR